EYINVHGTSTPVGDKNETNAIKAAFGDHAYKLAASSTKSMTGHLLGGAGGLEAGITALAVNRQTLPPTINLENPDPECDLDYVANESRQAAVSYALSNSFGFGGTNPALLFKRSEKGAGRRQRMVCQRCSSGPLANEISVPLSKAENILNTQSFASKVVINSTSRPNTSVKRSARSSKRHRIVSASREQSATMRTWSSPISQRR